MQCLANKILSVDTTFNYDFLLMSEHWLEEDQLSATKLKNYTLCTSYCRKKSIHGGVAIFIRDNLDIYYNVVDISEIAVEGIFECCCVFLESLNIILKRQAKGLKFKPKARLVTFEDSDCLSFSVSVDT
nr:unnamed protein product [Callosobruchus analis]